LETTEKQSPKAVSTLRALFTKENKPLTLYDLTQKSGLLSNEVSMALCYLLRQRYVTRKEISNDNWKIGRKTVYSYTYSPVKLPKENI
jgi:hypothetical protein